MSIGVQPPRVAGVAQPKPEPDKKPDEKPAEKKKDK